MASPGDAAQNHAKRRLAAIAIGGLAGLAIGLAAVYGIGLLLGNRPIDPACRGTVATAQRIAPLSRGQVAAMVAATHPIRVPDLSFLDASGTEKHLSTWRGRTVLLNLWATWCVPCREEMPTLDALQAKLGGPTFEVVAINIDTRDPDKPRLWLRNIGIQHLAYYADPEAKSFQMLKQVGKALGMPTTLLIDPAGCEIGTMAGPAVWNSSDAINLLRAVLRKSDT